MKERKKERKTVEISETCPLMPRRSFLFSDHQEYLPPRDTKSKWRYLSFLVFPHLPPMLFRSLSLLPVRLYIHAVTDVTVMIIKNKPYLSFSLSGNRLGILFQNGFGIQLFRFWVSLTIFDSGILEIRCDPFSPRIS